MRAIVFSVGGYAAEERDRQSDREVERIVADLVQHTTAAVDQETDEAVEHIICDLVGVVVTTAAAPRSHTAEDEVPPPTAAAPGHALAVPEWRDDPEAVADYVLVSPASPPGHSASKVWDASWFVLSNDVDEEPVPVHQPEPEAEPLEAAAEHDAKPANSSTADDAFPVVSPFTGTTDPRPNGGGRVFVPVAAVMSSILSSVVRTTGSGTLWALLPSRPAPSSRTPLQAPEPEPVFDENDDDDDVPVPRGGIGAVDAETGARGSPALVCPGSRISIAFSW